MEQNMFMDDVLKRDQKNKPYMIVQNYVSDGARPARPLTNRIYMQEMYWGELPGSRLTPDGITVRIENSVDSIMAIAVAE